jgi:8-oxo-dGTP diphosphatase
MDTSVVAMRRIRCVGAVIKDADGRILLIQRGHPPGEGLWSLPGGRVEKGESDHAAVVREIGEETGLSIVPGPFLGAVERPAPGGAVFDIRDYEAVLLGGELAAGDDAADVRWVSPAELMSLPITPGLAEALATWHILPGADRPPIATAGRPSDTGTGTGTGTGSTPHIATSRPPHTDASPPPHTNAGRPPHTNPQHPPDTDAGPPPEIGTSTSGAT